MNESRTLSSDRIQELKKPPELTWIDYLLMLLKVGSELEHALMVEYLYAGYSLGGPHVPAEHRDRVSRWRKTILTVAREEMGHLLCVQNLVRLLGGPVWLQRETFPWDSAWYPFSFRLEPLSLESLSCYVFAEMPDEIPDAANDLHYQEFLKDDKQCIVEEVKQRQEASGRKPHPVGELYRRILAIISDPELIPDSAFHGETLELQGSFDDWGRNYRPGDAELDPSGNVIKGPAHARRPRVLAVPMATRTQAVAALREIAGQGEAPQLGVRNVEPSHFDRFLEIYQDFKSSGAGLEWPPARAVAINPSTQSPAFHTNQGDFIQNDRSRRWGNLFNVRYRMLLMYLTHAFHLTPGSAGRPDLRGAVIHRAFCEMYNLKTIATRLVDMPLKRDEHDARRAGAPFELPYSLQLPNSGIDAWRLHRDLVASAEDLTRWMLASGDGAGIDGRWLAAVRDADRQAGEWIERVIAGMGPGGGVR